MTCITLTLAAIFATANGIPSSRPFQPNEPFQAADANHNTARSNKNTVAAPDASNASDGAGVDAAPANHNTARSNKNNVAGPGGGAGTGKPAVSDKAPDAHRPLKPNGAAPD